MVIYNPHTKHSTKIFIINYVWFSKGHLKDDSSAVGVNWFTKPKAREEEMEQFLDSTLKLFWPGDSESLRALIQSSFLITDSRVMLEFYAKKLIVPHFSYVNLWNKPLTVYVVMAATYKPIFQSTNIFFILLYIWYVNYLCIGFSFPVWLCILEKLCDGHCFPWLPFHSFLDWSCQVFLCYLIPGCSENSVITATL